MNKRGRAVPCGAAARWRWTGRAHPRGSDRDVRGPTRQAGPAGCRPLLEVELVHTPSTPLRKHRASESHASLRPIASSSPSHHTITDHTVTPVFALFIRRAPCPRPSGWRVAIVSPSLHMAAPPRAHLQSLSSPSSPSLAMSCSGMRQALLPATQNGGGARAVHCRRPSRPRA